jgi:hypothetical protein
MVKKKMKIRKLKNNDSGIVNLLLFLLTIFGTGALYSLFFLEIALTLFSSYIPDSDAKTFIFMGIYGVPLIILIVGVFSLVRSGLKNYGGG